MYIVYIFHDETVGHSAAAQYVVWLPSMLCFLVTWPRSFIMTVWSVCALSLSFSSISLPLYSLASLYDITALSRGVGWDPARCGFLWKCSVDFRWISYGNRSECIELMRWLYFDYLLFIGVVPLLHLPLLCWFHAKCAPKPPLIFI